MDENLELSQSEVNLPTVRKALGELQDGLSRLYGKKAPVIVSRG